MNEEKKVYSISVLDVIPNRFQPRIHFNEEELLELASSIREHGIIEPLILRKLGEKYEIIAGERRYKAACIVGLTQVPAMIVDADDKKSAELAVVENVQRKNLTSLEEAQSYKKLVEKGYTQEEIARKIGVSQASIANKIRLLNLCEEVQDALLGGKISERHARSLLALHDSESQKKVLNKIINERLTVKQTDEEINKMIGKIQEASVEEIISKSTDVIESNISPSIEDLLKVDESVEPIKSIEQMKEESNHQIPSFINTINPFQESDDEEMETLDFGDYTSDIINEDIKETQKEIPFAVEKIRIAMEDLKNNGYGINSEEFDFEDTYQIVVKIQKD